jgi:hypothetical protein
MMTIHGLAIDVYGRATIGMSSIFLGPALLHLANIAAGCDPDENTTNNNNSNSNSNSYDSDSICTNTIYGFRPSSLLTNIAAVSGIIGCIALPFIGSLMDHTNHRKYIGSMSGMVLCMIKIIEYVSLSHWIRSILPNIWFYIAILQIVASVTFYTHLTAAYAYLSELSSIPQQQSHYNTSLFVIMYASTLVFMVEVLSLSTIVPWWHRSHDGSNEASDNNNNNEDDDDVGTAQVALFITIITCTACFYYSWTYCFPYTTAKKVIPPHQSVYTAGFYTLYHTMKQLLSSTSTYHQPTTTTTTSSSIQTTTPALTTSQLHHHEMVVVHTFDVVDDNVCNNTSLPQQQHHQQPQQHSITQVHHRAKNTATFYILCSVSFSEAAANAIIVISTTYMKEVLQFNANNSYVLFYRFICTEKRIEKPTKKKKKI